MRKVTVNWQNGLNEYNLSSYEEQIAGNYLEYALKHKHDYCRVPLLREGELIVLFIIINESCVPDIQQQVNKVLNGFEVKVGSLKVLAHG